MATTAANSTEKVDNTNHDTVEVDPIFVASAVETIGNVVENAVKAASSQSPLYPSHTLAHNTKTTENQCQKCEFVGKTAAGLKEICLEGPRAPSTMRCLLVLLKSVVIVLCVITFSSFMCIIFKNWI